MTVSTIKAILCFVLVLVVLAVAGIVGNGNHYANCRAADAVVTNSTACKGA